MLPFLLQTRLGINRPPDPPNPPILAGIEWEFLVAHSDTHDHHPDDTRWYSRPDPSLEGLPEGPNKLIRKSVSSARQTLAKVEETVRSGAELMVFSKQEALDRNTGMHILQQNGVKQIDHVSWLYQAYSTTADSSLHARDPDSKRWMDMRYDWLGAELRSRVFEENELNDNPTCPSPTGAGAATKEITSVCASLRENMRLQINHSCALQVTISHQTPNGLSLLNLKRVLTLVWVLEPLIFGLCAPYRPTKRYCLPIRTSSDLSTIPLHKLPKTNDLNPNQNHPYTPYWQQEFNAHIGNALSPLLTTQPPTTNDSLPLLSHHLLHLWHATNAPTLGCLIRSTNIPYDRLSIAIKFLGDSPITNGVEFRMHEGTLDPILTKLWVNFCVALVRKATRLDKTGFGALVTKFVKGTMGIDARGTGEGEGEEDSGKGTYASIMSMLRGLDVPEEEILLWRKKMAWWGERPGVDLVLPLPRPWVMDGVVSGRVDGQVEGDAGVTGGVRSSGNINGRALKGGGKDLPLLEEGPFLPRLEDDEHRLC